MKNNIFKYLRQSWVLIVIMLVVMILNEALSLPEKIIYDSSSDLTASSESANIKESKAGTESEANESAVNRESSSESEADSEGKSNKSQKHDVNYTDDELASMAEKLISGMSLEEKVAQLFIITPEALTGQKGAFLSVSEADKKALAQYPVGGFILFSQNLSDYDQVESLITDLQANSEIPLFLAVDEEGGTVARVANSGLFDVEKYNDMGNITSREEAFDVGQTIGTYLGDLGFNLDFAPVADVNSNPENTVIGTRAFSTDYETAAELVSACVKGFKAADTLCTLKHFPGHGDTSQDSHTETATTDKTLQELEENEFKTFTAGIDAGADLIMVGHITASNVDDVPATFSEAMVNGILRGNLGYDGIVITDALNMGAVTNRYTSAEAAVAAVKAGCDILLMPADFRDAYNGLIKAVQNKQVSEDRIDQSVTRILKKKIESGII